MTGKRVCQEAAIEMKFRAAGSASAQAGSASAQERAEHYG